MSIGEPARFLAPGTGTVEADVPGPYLVWHEYRTTYENRSYNAAPELPGGVRFTVSAPDGSLLKLQSTGTQSWTKGGVQRRAVGAFEATMAGRYTISVDGDFPPRVIAVGRDQMARMLATIGMAIVAVLAGMGSGVGLAVYAFGRRADEARRLARERTGTMETTPPPAADAEQSIRDTVLLVYILQACSFLAGITLFAAVVLDYVKRDEAAGTWLESHFRWQIRTFWWTVVWGVLGFLTALILVGFAIWFAATVWFIYRVAKGWIELRAGKPMP